MSDNAVLLSYDTRVNDIAFWTVIGIGLVLALLAVCYNRYRLGITISELKWFFIIEYVIILLLLTTLLRERPIFPDGFDKSFFSNKNGLIGNRISEIFVNVLMFLPIGWLIGNVSTKWCFRLLYLFVGILFSFCVETLQYILDKGVADMVDVFCNALGLLFGCILWHVTYILYKYL